MRNNWKFRSRLMFSVTVVSMFRLMLEDIKFESSIKSLFGLSVFWKR